jgi:O-methyltransferase
MLIKSIVDQTIIPAVERSHKLKRLLYYISEKVGLYGYTDYKRIFIENGRKSLYNEEIRREVVKRFEEIDRNVPISTSKTDGLFLAEALFSIDAPDDDVVECGCYAGGSTAKLSILSKITGRLLKVFDSFSGLPKTGTPYIRDYNVRESQAWMSEWTEGKYAARLEYVKQNIERFGDLSVCRFYPGWFDVTLTEENLPELIAFAFVDVDLATSARTCLEAIWPHMCKNGVYFSHDVAFIKVLQSILDVNLWQEVLKEFPPLMIGAGYGMGDASPELGFFVKGSVTSEYINSLTLSK